MPIENRNLPAGTRMVARYMGQEYSAEVVEVLRAGRHRTGWSALCPAAGLQFSGAHGLPVRPRCG